MSGGLPRDGSPGAHARALATRDSPCDCRHRGKHHHGRQQPRRLAVEDRGPETRRPARYHPRGSQCRGDAGRCYLGRLRALLRTRRHHIPSHYDPPNRLPSAEQFAQRYRVSPDAVIADALSTGLFVMGLPAGYAYVVEPRRERASVQCL